MKLILPCDEAERKKLYRWHKKGIYKKIRLINKEDLGRPKNHYILNVNYFKKKHIDFDFFLETVRELRRHVQFAIGLPLSLLRYGYLQVSIVYIYSDSENMPIVKDILSDYPFLTFKTISKSVLERRTNYKDIPLLSIEDTILLAIKDARNLMVAYTLLTKRTNKINHSLLFQEMLNQQVKMNALLPLLSRENSQFFSYHSIESDTSELDAIKKASKNLLRNTYKWDLAISILKDKFTFIDRIR